MSSHETEYFADDRGRHRKAYPAGTPVSADVEHFDSDEEDTGAGEREPLQKAANGISYSNGEPRKVSRQYDNRKRVRLRRLISASSICQLAVRYCCFIILAVVIIVIVLLSAGGIYVYEKGGTIDGQSPPWYPSPKGGTSERWSKSYKKAAAMVGKMTLAEKVNITTGIGWQMGMCVGNTGPAIYTEFPSLCLQDGQLGLRFVDNVTVTPAGITVGATWNRELMYRRGRLLGQEARTKGVNVLLGPCVGPLGRTPLGGRNWEGFGADPVLQGIAAAETIRGIQEEGVMATIKHLIGNEQEHFRQPFEYGTPNAISSNIDDRTLHELYLWPFADAVRAGVASVMCSYQQVNNSYACQNSKLLNGILKDELGFQGFVQSDWWAQPSGVASALAGLDMVMPGNSFFGGGDSFWGPKLSTAILNGSLPLERLNDMVTRIVAAWYQIGQDNRERWPLPPEGGPNFSSWTWDEVGLLHPGSNDGITGFVNKFKPAYMSGEFSHKNLVRRIAAEGIVLLKNEGQVLPLTYSGWSVRDDTNHDLEETKFRLAVIGEDAILDKDGPNVCEDRGCNKGTLATGWGSGTAEFPHLMPPSEGIRRELNGDNVDFTVFPSNVPPSHTNSTAIQEQDLCIVFVNADSGEGFIWSDGIKGDRNSLLLQKGGEELTRDVVENCGSRNSRYKKNEGKAKSFRSPTIVVIHSVGPVILSDFVDNEDVKAVLWAGLPGQESGLALADVLFGDVNPSGHLPFSMANRLEDYGPGGKVMYLPNALVPQQNFDEGVYIDYRWADANGITPRFDFGWGLSYTYFEMNQLKIIPLLGGTIKRPARLPAPRPEPEVRPPYYEDDPLDPDEVLFPPNLRRLNKYIYPYIDSPDDIKDGPRYPYPDMRSGKLSQAGGGEGGNPDLYEVVARVEITVQNTGDRDGFAVPQLYLNFPEQVYEDIDEYDEDEMQANLKPAKDDGALRPPEDGPLDKAAAESATPTPKPPSGHRKGREPVHFPRKVLRGFEKVMVHTKVGKENAEWEKKVTFELTRRDVSYWSARLQNWVVPDGTFGVELGFASRDVRLSGKLFKH